MALAERRIIQTTEEMPMPVKTISVTKNDIRLGKPKNPDRCPVARAIRRACGFADVSVGLIRTHWKDGFSYYSRHHSTKLENFVNDFDAGKPVRPITFQLRWKK